MAILALIIAAVVAILDQVFKILAVNAITENGPITVIDGLLDFVYVENRGAAFGILSDSRWFFIILTSIVIVGFIVALFKNKSANKMFYISSALIIGGGIGNLIDRIFLGYVIDYIAVSFFPPVCNFADYAVTVGTVLFIIYIIFQSDFLKEKKPIDKVAEDNGTN